MARDGAIPLPEQPCPHCRPQREPIHWFVAADFRGILVPGNQLFLACSWPPWTSTSGPYSAAVGFRWVGRCTKPENFMTRGKQLITLQNDSPENCKPQPDVRSDVPAFFAACRRYTAVSANEISLSRAKQMYAHPERVLARE